MLSYSKDLSSFYFEGFKTKVESYYPMLLKGKQTLVTVYKINSNSTFNANSESIFEQIGPNSPLRFTKINNYPLFALEGGQSISVDMTEEAGYVSQEVMMSAVILPFAVKLKVGDFVKMDLMDETRLFRVEPAMDISSIDVSNYYKIQLKLSYYDASLITSQITSEEQFIFSSGISINSSLYSTFTTLVTTTQSYITKFFNALAYSSTRYYSNSTGSFDQLENIYMRSVLPGNSNINVLASLNNSLLNPTIYNSFLTNDFSSFINFSVTDYVNNLTSLFQDNAIIGLHTSVENQALITDFVSKFNTYDEFVKFDNYCYSNYKTAGFNFATTAASMLSPASLSIFNSFNIVFDTTFNYTPLHFTTLMNASINDDKVFLIALSVNMTNYANEDYFIEYLMILVNIYNAVIVEANLSFVDALVVTNIIKVLNLVAKTELNRNEVIVYY